MIITIEQQLVSCIEEQDGQISFEHSVPREDFSGNFAEVDLGNVRQLSYEPDRNLFHIVETDHSLAVLASPSEDSRMNFISNNANAISSWFKQKHDKFVSETVVESVQ